MPSRVGRPYAPRHQTYEGLIDAYCLSQRSSFTTPSEFSEREHVLYERASDRTAVILSSPLSFRRASLCYAWDDRVLEPAISDVTGRRSDQLNYHAAKVVGCRLANRLAEMPDFNEGSRSGAMEGNDRCGSPIPPR